MYIVSNLIMLVFLTVGIPVVVVYSYPVDATPLSIDVVIGYVIMVIALSSFGLVLNCGFLCYPLCFPGEDEEPDIPESMSTNPAYDEEFLE